MHLTGYRKLWTNWLLIVVTLATALFVVACGTLEETGFIAYNSGVDGKRDIGVIRPDGTSERIVITHPSDDFSPIWSPDGKRMAFLSNRDGNVELYVASADGSNPMRLTNTKVDESSPTWSPDGRRLAYLSPDNKNKPHIFIVDLSALLPQRLTFGTIAEVDPAWSPNGSWIAYVGLDEKNDSGGIFIRNPDGVNRITLTRAPDSLPVWSPDSTWIAYVSRQDGNEEVYIVAIEGYDRVGTPIRLTEHDGRDFAPSWSPESSQIAFLSDRNGNLDIFAVDTNGENLVALTRNEVDETEVIWGPADKIVFVSQLSDTPDIFIMNSDGSDQRSIKSGSEGHSNPSW